MPCIIEDFINQTVFNDLTSVHNSNTVSNVCNNAQVMGDVNNGHVQFFLQAVNQIQNLSLNGYVQSGSWLVADQDLWTTSNSDSNNNTLSHTTGELMWILIITAFWVRNTYFAKHFDCFFFCFLTFQTLMQLDTFLNLFTNNFQWVQRCHWVLHNHGNFFTTDCHPFFFCFIFGDIYSIVHDGTADDATIGIQHTDKRFCKYRFTGTRFSYDC